MGSKAKESIPFLLEMMYGYKGKDEVVSAISSALKSIGVYNSDQLRMICKIIEQGDKNKINGILNYVSSFDYFITKEIYDAVMEGYKDENVKLDILKKYLRKEVNQKAEELCKQNIAAIETAAAIFYADQAIAGNARYPKTIREMVPNYLDKIPICPLGEYVYDNSNGTVSWIREHSNSE